MIYRLMKRIIILCAIAAGALLLPAGCTKDNHQEAKVNAEVIGFDTYLGRDAQTKGAVLDDEVLKKGFGVSAFYTGQDLIADWHKTDEAFEGPNFMRNQKVSHNGTSWEYSPVKYWPTMEGDKISFFAYAPYATQKDEYGFSSNFDHFTNMNYSLLFTLQKKADEMVDFVAASAYNQTYKDNGGANKVNFKFIHTLSRVSFSALTSEGIADGTHIVLRGAELLPEGFYRRGMYYFYNSAAESIDAKRQGCWMHKKGNDDSLGNGFNDNDDDNADNNYDLASILNTTELKFGAAEGKEYKATGLEIKGTSNGIFKKDASKKQHYLFLIPAEDWFEQGSSYTGGLKKNTAAVRFTYDIVTADGNLAEGYSCTSATKTVYLPEGILRQGKAYNVTFTFNVDQIEVSANVEGWDDKTDDSTVEVPFTPDSVK